MLRLSPQKSWVGLPVRAATWFWEILSQTITRWNRNDGNTLAASMAYYAAFSFFPLIAVLISALGFALEFSSSAQDAKKQLLEFISNSAAPALAQEVNSLLAEALAEVQSRAAYSGPVALVILLFGAIGVFSQLDTAFQRLWQDTTPHDHGVRAAIVNALWNRLKAFLTLLALGVLLMVAFVFDIALAAVRTWTADLQVGILAWRAVHLGFSIGLNAIVLTLIYKLLPQAAVRWRHAVCGGLFAAIMWQLGSQLLARFIVGGNYSAYGVVGSFIAVMLWVYCASILLFLGGQLVQVLGRPDPPPPPPGSG